MRAGHKRIGIAKSPHDIRRRSHRAWNNPNLIELRRSCALTMHTHLLTEMLLKRRIVMMNVNRPNKVDLWRELRERLLHRFHHPAAIFLRVPKREKHIRKVVMPRFFFNRKKRKILIRQSDAVARAHPVSDFVVMLLDSLTHITRPGVDHQPNLCAVLRLSLTIKRC